MVLQCIFIYLDRLEQVVYTLYVNDKKLLHGAIGAWRNRTVKQLCIILHIRIIASIKAI